MTTTDRYDTEATERARRMYPGLNPEASKGAARSHRAIVRQLSIAAECNDLRNRGVRNAAQVIADRRGITNTTVRALLHRASTELGITIVAPPAVPSLEGMLRLVADWYASSEGRDVLHDELTAAGYVLPDADR